MDSSAAFSSGIPMNSKGTRIKKKKKNFKGSIKNQMKLINSNLLRISTNLEVTHTHTHINIYIYIYILLDYAAMWETCATLNLASCHWHRLLNTLGIKVD